MTSVQVPMSIFAGEKIYGEFVGEELVFWIPYNLYLRIHKHVMQYLPRSVRDSASPGFRRAIALEKFIQKWLISISRRDCKWFLGNKTPEQCIKLASHPSAPLSNFALRDNQEEALTIGVVTSISALMDFNFSIDFGASLITTANFIL